MYLIYKAWCGLNQPGFLQNINCSRTYQEIIKISGMQLRTLSQLIKQACRFLWHLQPQSFPKSVVIKKFPLDFSSLSAGKINQQPGTGVSVTYKLRLLPVGYDYNSNLK